ncbi:MAG TPA: TonB-dependent receptor [Sphingobium sp.]|nr:TonB-dependent receptor [Sphingobium sp.]
MSISLRGARALRRSILASASLTGLAASAPALAQASAAGASEEMQAIVITGSRIVQTGMDTPVPVTAVQADELKAMDPTTLINSVSQLPQFYGNQTPNNSAFFTRAGTGNLNMRGLGANRTLTLLNGRRMASSSAFGGVDINIFPEAMIKGIETVTGGASAAYGTDAVAGVVNFLLDTRYEGLSLEVQGGMTSRGDGGNYEASFAFGTRLGERGHFLISVERAEQEGIHNYVGRNWYQGWGAAQVGGIWRGYPHMKSMNGSFDGIILAPGTAIQGLKFDRNGNVSPFVPGAVATPMNPDGSVNLNAIGTPGARTVGGDGDDLGGDPTEPFTLWPDTDRSAIFAYADYEIGNNFKVFAQYVRGTNHLWQWNTPRGSLLGQPTAITIFQDNAYLPEALRQTMIDNDIASFSLRRTGSLKDIGNAYFEDWTTQNVGTVGFEGTLRTGGFLDNWSVQGYYQYGHSKRVWDQYGMRVDRIFAAVDAVDDSNGNIVCRVSTFAGGAEAFPGCQPLNLFGRGNASPQAVDYVLGNDVGEQISTPLFFANLGFTGETDSYTATKAKRNITTFQQHLAELSLSGTLFDNWAGPVSLALGGAYRRESIYQVVRDSTNRASNHDSPAAGGFTPVRCNDPTIGLRGVSVPDCGNTVGYQYSKVSNIQGSTTVKEAFVETLFPLVSEQSWMKQASLSAAGRWANYSGAGDIWAYKIGLDLAFSNAIRLRGTYSRDVRAGNLSERFDKTGGAANVDDPRTTDVQEAIPVTIFSGGNPAIKPEKADTFTAGAVFEPGFIPGFSASVDWYRVSIKDAIGRVGTNEVLRRCLIDNDPQFCNLVTLVSDVPSLIGDQYVNVAKSQVEGVDAEIAYRRGVRLFGGDESIATRLFASWLITRSDTGAPNAANPNGVTTSFDGLTGIAPDTGALGMFPSLKMTGSLTYRNGGFTTFFNGRYIGKGKNAHLISGQPAQVGVNIADNSVPGIFYLDMRLSYRAEIANADAEIFLSVTNLLDKDPPITPTFAAFTGYATQANVSLFDVLGRRWVIGAKVKF